MKNQGYDQRVRLTKSMIKSAFLDLLSKKNVRHITVRELCEKAQINRATFYAHYMDIYDLKQQLENELLSSFSEVFAKSVAEADGSFSSEKMFAEVFSLLRKNSEQCVILLNSDAVLPYIIRGIIWLFSLPFKGIKKAKEKRKQKKEKEE